MADGQQSDGDGSTENRNAPIAAGISSRYHGKFQSSPECVQTERDQAEDRDECRRRNQIVPGIGEPQALHAATFAGEIRPGDQAVVPEQAAAVLGDDLVPNDAGVLCQAVPGTFPDRTR